VRALTVSPGEPGRLRLEDLEEPQPGPDQLLVSGLAVGVCATDREILAGQYGTAPPGRPPSSGPSGASTSTSSTRRARGAKPALVEGLGATYHRGAAGKVVHHVRPDVIIEATGAPSVVAAALEVAGPYRITCLAGLPAAGGTVPVPLAAAIRDIVLGNNVIVGSINASLRHYRTAAQALAAADRSWLSGLVSRRVPLGDAQDAFRPREDDVKVVIDL
jgi:threonine dehydrogenase-like Zn-dependent dehydrogenase